MKKDKDFNVLVKKCKEITKNKNHRELTRYDWDNLKAYIETLETKYKDAVRTLDLQ